MRRTLPTLCAFALILAVTLPAFAGPPTISCTIMECCQQPCGTWCVDWNGNYQDCQTYVGACDGACDLSLNSLSETGVDGVDGTAETPAFLLDLASPPLMTPASTAGACNSAA